MSGCQCPDVIFSSLLSTRTVTVNRSERILIAFRLFRAKSSMKVAGVWLVASVRVTTVVRRSSTDSTSSSDVFVVTASSHNSSAVRMTPIAQTTAAREVVCGATAYSVRRKSRVRTTTSGIRCATEVRTCSARREDADVPTTPSFTTEPALTSASVLVTWKVTHMLKVKCGKMTATNGECVSLMQNLVSKRSTC